MSTSTVGFIGGGRVARIMLGGWSRAGRSLTEILVSDPDANVLDRLKSDFPEIQTAVGDSLQAAAQKLVVLAVHPPAIATVLSTIGPSLRADAVLVSLAPKLTIGKLSALLGGFSRIVRMIPNAPSFVGQGFNPVAFAPSLAEQDRRGVVQQFDGLGEMPEVAEETLEIYAILTAMGPTYLWPQLYELRSLSQSFGLSAEDASLALAAMVRGVLATMNDAGLSQEQVEDLIPVKPLADVQPALLEAYRTKLRGVMEKIRPGA
ncbi:MAG: NAD(P)-binding domain-containing protein [Pirellulaceae bacterium]|nr:NAD(P)-binding domain-containing protein [Pirellulaceae bacterium]